MKKFYAILPALLLFALGAGAQIFWTENFESGSSAGLDVTGYTTGPNGPWTQMLTGTEESGPNQWYVSCAEAGHLAGTCGTDCATSLGLGATLHVGASTAMSVGDMGASYDAGGFCGLGACVTTSRRAVSPVINCTGRYTITMKGYYIMRGQAGVDYATFWYYDGTTWSLLYTPPMTAPICPGISPQGLWTAFSVALPPSANNNPNVKIGFQWVNNDDGVGTDPSFAVDSFNLSVPVGGGPVPSFSVSPSTTTCQDSTLSFTNTSTGSRDSAVWSMPGFTFTSAAAHASPISVTFPVAGTYTMTLTEYSGGTAYPVAHVVTVNPTPHPTITVSGHMLSVSGAYTSYQWLNGITAITGAVSSSYTVTSPASYTVVVDSDGCYGYATIVYYPLVAQPLGLGENSYAVSQTANGMTLFASLPLDNSLAVTMYDATGRRIISDTWAKGTSSKQFRDLSLAPGLYIIKLNNLNTSAVLKLMK